MLYRGTLEKQRVTIRLSNAPEPATALVQQIDEDHANPKRLWKEMSAPEYLSRAQLDKLQDASQLKRERVDFGYTSNTSTEREYTVDNPYCWCIRNRSAPALAAPHAS